MNLKKSINNSFTLKQIETKNDSNTSEVTCTCNHAHKLHLNRKFYKILQYDTFQRSFIWFVCKSIVCYSTKVSSILTCLWSFLWVNRLYQTNLFYFNVPNIGLRIDFSSCCCYQWENECCIFSVSLCICLCVTWIGAVNFWFIANRIEYMTNKHF